jgi:hypothetical protein
MDRRPAVLLSYTFLLGFELLVSIEHPGPALSSSGLGHMVLSHGTRVRLPMGSPIQHNFFRSRPAGPEPQTIWAVLLRLRRVRSRKKLC